MFDFPITDIIPQRSPFIMVDHLTDFNPMSATTEFQVVQSCILVENGHLSEAGMTENYAQSCAAYIGYRNRTQPVKIGVIGAIRNLQVLDMPKVGTTVKTSIEIKADIFDMLMIEAVMKVDEKIVSTCEMKISLID